jgi:hypothetical protein
METRHSIARALVRFALVSAAGVAAASLWASARPEQGLLLDALTWEEEVVSASTGPWPEDGWYRLVPSEDGIEVAPVRPSVAAAVPRGALFFRLPGTTLKTGLRGSYRHLEVLQQPKIGREHHMTLASVRFSLQVEEVAAGVQYAVGYGGRTYTYLLGPRGSETSVRAVADLDGDAKPDFLVDVNDEMTYLLLSTRARPGQNLPTAELPAHGC